MRKLVRVEVRPGVYTKLPEDQVAAQEAEAEAKKRPPARNKARRSPRLPEAPDKA